RARLPIERDARGTRAADCARGGSRPAAGRAGALSVRVSHAQAHAPARAARGPGEPAGLPRAGLPRLRRDGRRGRIPRDDRGARKRDAQAPFFGRAGAFFDLTADAGLAPATFSSRGGTSSSSSATTARSIEPFIALRRNPSETLRWRSRSVTASIPVTPGRSNRSVLPLQPPRRSNFLP